ncbi:MAG: hypothetical protein IH840_17080 [Candidatus Heimdallarchaeota archaeon]|nr:hypothetical protein [Candidatus Heimdallarchaeota archaeon]
MNTSQANLKIREKYAMYTVFVILPLIISFIFVREFFSPTLSDGTLPRAWVVTILYGLLPSFLILSWKIHTQPKVCILIQMSMHPIFVHQIKVDISFCLDLVLQSIYFL